MTPRRVKKYWTTGDIAKVLGVCRQTVVGWVQTQRTFPPPDIQVADWFGWDPGREQEIRQWRADRAARKPPPRHLVKPRQLPPVQRLQVLTDQQLKLQRNGFVAIPASEVRHGDIRPWGGVVNKISRTSKMRLYVIHDDLLGSAKAIGGRSLVMIQPRPEMEQDAG